MVGGRCRRRQRPPPYTPSTVREGERSERVFVFVKQALADCGTRRLIESSNAQEPF